MPVAWAPGGLVVPDSRITRHHAPDGHGGLPRLLHRVTAAGDVPACVDGALSHVVEGDDTLPRTPTAVDAGRSRTG